MPRRRPHQSDPRSTTPGFIRRRDQQGRNRAYVFDLTEDRYVETDKPGKVSGKRLQPGEIPIEVEEAVYGDGPEQDEDFDEEEA